MCIIGVAISAKGQDQPACTQQSFEEAETSYRMRSSGSEMKGRAERKLKALVENCAATPERDQMEEHLKVVQEELAEANLQIAKFYLGDFYEGRGGRAGARSRLQTIIERYAKFTKLDEVLSLLGRLNVDEEHLDNAATIYKRLIKDFPNSQYAGEASIQLNRIEAMRVKQTP